jgi:hypothetical protein
VNSADWDNDTVLESWCAQQRAIALEYLSRQPVGFGELGEWPGWHIAPYVAVWAVESVAVPGKVGWWVITGDLPTDYASGAETPDPRAAVAAFSERWVEVSKAMEEGKVPEGFTVGSPENAAELGAILRQKAQFLSQCANDESVWGA